MLRKTTSNGICRYRFHEGFHILINQLSLNNVEPTLIYYADIL